MDAFFAKIEEILGWLYDFIASIIGLANGNKDEAEEGTEATE